MTQDDQVTLGSIRNVVKQAGKLFRISWILDGVFVVDLKLNCH